MLSENTQNTGRNNAQELERGTATFREKHNLHQLTETKHLSDTLTVSNTTRLLDEQTSSFDYNTDAMVLAEQDMVDEDKKRDLEVQRVRHY